MLRSVGLTALFCLALFAPPLVHSNLDQLEDNGDQIFTTNQDIVVTAPTFIATFPSGRPSFEIRPVKDARFYFDFNFKSIYELDASRIKSQVYDLALVNFTASVTDRKDPLTDIQETKAILTTKLTNNATLRFAFTCLYYEGNQTLVNHRTANISLALQPYLPALVLQLKVSDWPFQSPKNSFQMLTSVKINVGPLEVGTGSYDQFQVLSVPYYNSLYLNSYFASQIILDDSANWTTSQRNFELTEAAEPVGANVYVTTPYFTKSMTFSSFVELASDSQGFNGTSLLVVIGVLVGVFLIAGIAIFLLMRYAGTKHDQPISPDSSGEMPTDIPEKQPLLANS